MIQPVLCRKEATRKIRGIVNGGGVLETAAINIYVGYTYFQSKSCRKFNLSSETLAEHVVFAFMKWFVSKVQETECPPHVVLELATRRPITQG